MFSVFSAVLSSLVKTCMEIGGGAWQSRGEYTLAVHVCVQQFGGVGGCMFKFTALMQNMNSSFPWQSVRAISRLSAKMLSSCAKQANKMKINEKGETAARGSAEGCANARGASQAWQ